jgi:hypothetical protein
MERASGSVAQASEGRQDFDFERSRSSTPGIGSFANAVSNL